MTRAEARAHFGQKFVEWEQEFGGRLPRAGEPGFEDGEGSLLDHVVQEALKIGVTGKLLAEVMEDLAAIARTITMDKEKTDG